MCLSVSEEESNRDNDQTIKRLAPPATVHWHRQLSPTSKRWKANEATQHRARPSAVHRRTDFTDQVSRWPMSLALSFFSLPEVVDSYRTTGPGCMPAVCRDWRESSPGGKSICIPFGVSPCASGSQQVDRFIGLQHNPPVRTEKGKKLRRLRKGAQNSPLATGKQGVGEDNRARKPVDRLTIARSRKTIYQACNREKGGEG